MMRSLAAWLVLACLVLGCGKGGEEDLGPLHQVAGRVVKNGKPVSGGLIKLHAAQEQKSLMVNGIVDQEGNFKLDTVDQSGRRPGVPVGQYEIIYSPPGTDQNVMPVALPGLVKVDGPNSELIVDIAKGKR